MPIANQTPVYANLLSFRAKQQYNIPDLFFVIGSNNLSFMNLSIANSDSLSLLLNCHGTSISSFKALIFLNILFMGGIFVIKQKSDHLDDRHIT